MASVCGSTKPYVGADSDPTCGRVSTVMWGVNVRAITVAIFLSLAGAAGCGADPTAPVQQDRLSVLFIGNSLTYWYELPKILEDLFAAGGAGEIHTRDLSRPNWGLQDHWHLTTVTSIIAEGWDVVVLQQGPSATEGRPSLLDYSQRFAEEIRGAGGTPALYMVWPSQSRFFDFDGVSDSYSTAAELVDGLLFPAGEAWRVAWELDPDLELYGPDAFHPSALGSYLAAVVMYEQLSGRDPRDLPTTVATTLAEELTPELATFLHEIAVEANARYAQAEFTRR